MEFGELELKSIRKQLPDSLVNEPIREIAIGFVEEMDGDLCEVVLKGVEEEPMTIYMSRQFLKQRGIDDGQNKFLALVEYKCANGQKLELVKLSDSSKDYKKP